MLNINKTSISLLNNNIIRKSISNSLYINLFSNLSNNNNNNNNNKNDDFVIDIHTHFLPIKWPNWAKKYPSSSPWPWMRPDPNNHEKAMLMLGDKEFRPVHYACWDMNKRLYDMDQDNIDHQIISATPILFQYERPIEQALSVAQYFNDLALEMVKDTNGRISTLCQVPLQDIDVACEEASRAFKSGHKGVQIGNHVGPKDLDDEGLIIFLQHCASENIPVLVHPWDMLEKERLSKYMMGWTVGMPAETQLSIVAMILGGVFDRVDENLKICFAHGGGSFAFLLGRLDNAYIYRNIARGKAQHPPSHYLGRFYTDSAVFDDDTLKLLVSKIGEDKVILGSDYPFPLGEQEVGKLVRESNNLSSNVKTKILGENAKKLFNI